MPQTKERCYECATGRHSEYSPAHALFCRMYVALASERDPLSNGETYRIGVSRSTQEILDESARQASTPALYLLHAWIGREPSYRAVDRMARMGSLCVVELRAKSGVFTSETQETFDAAIRTALMIAHYNGEK